MDSYLMPMYNTYKSTQLPELLLTVKGNDKIFTKLICSTALLLIFCL